MPEPRFEETGEDSFFGALVYDRVVPKHHFLRRLRDLIPWERFTRMLLEYYQGDGRQGRPPYNPALILRMLLIAYLYNLSERQTEQMVNENIPMKYFVGLAVDESAPDHSTLTAFKARLKACGRTEAFERMLVEIVKIAQEKGIEFGEIQIVDSAHTVANVNTAKDGERQNDGKPPRDPDAKWGVKGDRLVRTEEGKMKRVAEHFYGYKVHMSLNAATELVTSVVVTAGNVPDGKVFSRVLDRDLSQGLPVRIVGGDRAYDDSHNHLLLWSRGIHSALLLKANRTMKKDKNKGVWEALRATPEYRRGRGERYKIERKFGEAKTRHGLRRCRYLGRVGYAIQAFMTAIVLNLKRLVRMLTGTGMDNRVRVPVTG